MIRLCAPLVLLALAPSLVAAANMAGYGALSCGKITQGLNDPTTQHGILSWALGAMSGANTIGIAAAGSYRDLAGLDRDTLLAAIKSRCAETPDGVFSHTVERIFDAQPVRRWR